MNKPRVSRKQVEAELICGSIDFRCNDCPTTCPFYTMDDCLPYKTNQQDIVSSFLDAYKLIEEQANTLLKISQEPICSVCQGVKDVAREQWEKSKEWV